MEEKKEITAEEAKAIKIAKELAEIKKKEESGLIRMFHPDYGENWYSELTFKHTKNNRLGWIRYSDMSDADLVPTSEIKINDTRLKEKDDEIAKLKALLAKQGNKEVAVKEEITVEEMKADLKLRGIAFHHRAGDDKIKILYNENRE